jgi:hypothetical protein
VYFHELARQKVNRWFFFLNRCLVTGRNPLVLALTVIQALAHAQVVIFQIADQAVAYLQELQVDALLLQQVSGDEFAGATLDEEVQRRHPACPAAGHETDVADAAAKILDQRQERLPLCLHACAIDGCGGMGKRRPAGGISSDTPQKLLFVDASVTDDEQVIHNVASLFGHGMLSDPMIRETGVVFGPIDVD